MKINVEKTVREMQTAPGQTKTPGVRRTRTGYEFSIEVPKGEPAVLILYIRENDKEERMEIPFSESSRTGGLLSVQISGIRPEKIQYQFQIGEELIPDPYGRRIFQAPEFGRKASPGQLRSGFKEETYPWTDEGFQGHKLNDSVLYKLQVRSFTMHKSSGVRKKGTFAGLIQKIPYLKELGITGVLLMPAYEYREILKKKPRGSRKYQESFQNALEETERINCWGYTGDACYFAPKSAFCGSGNPVREFKDLVNSLHEAGIECLMEFYFDQTTAPGKMLDILRYWKCAYHIDGFHLMGEGIHGELFTKDPVLAGSKLFFHHVDQGEVPGIEKSETRTVAEYEEGFLYAMRRMLKGDENAGEEFLWRNKRNPAGYGVINYLADQDGFSMMDMVSYEERHNEANGEKNQDGVKYNCTWNCGTEGPSRKKKIRDLRLKQLKNAFTMLLLAQGTPLIFQGDEWGNSQDGNNNTWCQDNETGWIDWKRQRQNQELFEFVKQALSFRSQHGVLHMEEEPRNVDYKALGYPDLSYHGSQAWVLEGDSNLRSFGMMYCGDYGNSEREFLFAACNFHWVSHEIALPGMPGEILWKEVMRTDTEEGGGFLKSAVIRAEKVIEVPPRTMIILTGKQEEKAWGSGNILRRLQGTSF